MKRDSSGNMRNLPVQRINAPRAADFPVGRDLAQLLPELQHNMAPSRVTSDHSEPNPEQARFRLFDLVATVIQNLAGSQRGVVHNRR